MSTAAGKQTVKIVEPEKDENTEDGDDDSGVDDLVSEDDEVETVVPVEEDKAKESNDDYSVYDAQSLIRLIRRWRVRMKMVKRQQRRALWYGFISCKAIEVYVDYFYYLSKMWTKPLPETYDADKVTEYFSLRPHVVALRLLEVINDIDFSSSFFHFQTCPSSLPMDMVISISSVKTFSTHWRSEILHP